MLWLWIGNFCIINCGTFVIIIVKLWNVQSFYKIMMGHCWFFQPFSRCSWRMSLDEMKMRRRRFTMLSACFAILLQYLVPWLPILFSANSSMIYTVWIELKEKLWNLYQISILCFILGPYFTCLLYMPWEILYSLWLQLRLWIYQHCKQLSWPFTWYPSQLFWMK